MTSLNPSIPLTVAIKATAAQLRDLAIRKHYQCEDSWYSCPKSPDGCADSFAGKECNCGADEHNAKVEQRFSEIEAMLSVL
jgi:hypothetical protein